MTKTNVKTHTYIAHFDFYQIILIVILSLENFCDFKHKQNIIIVNKVAKKISLPKAVVKCRIADVKSPNRNVPSLRIYFNIIIDIISELS